MTIARKEIVPKGAEGVFHCVSRCVRRAFLCGEDPYSGRSFEHRREWIRKRLENLAAWFAIEVCGFAVMSNHVHLVLRTRPDWVRDWDDQEVAERWLSIFPQKANTTKSGAKESLPPWRPLVRDRKTLKEIRARLSSLSWFMRCLNEHIARRANREDGCKGRFWEGRFRCQALLDEAASLACLAYVDLNPIRANVAQTPEESRFTSAHERIQGKTTEPESTKKPSAALQERMKQPGIWLCPIRDEFGQDREGLLSLSLDEYLQVLDWTGRQLVFGKKGVIPGNLAPILVRLEINQERWLDTVKHFGRRFKLAAGRLESMTRAAKQSGRRWYKGFKFGREAFSLP